jgi:hypothetical protein
MFAKINRAQLLAATGWSSPDLNNRAHANQLALAFGLVLPAESGVYIAPDCFALRLQDALVREGFSRAQAGGFVREHHEKWMYGLERIEWPQLVPPPEPMPWAPTKRALDEGITSFPSDVETYFTVVKLADGALHVACGTLVEIIKDTMMPPMTGQPARVPTNFNCTLMREVYEGMLKAAEKAGVDLGAPFTRPVGHPEHTEWYAAVEVRRALSFARQKIRKPPGPPPAKGKQRRPVAAKMQRERA